jgi:hypothetical protein
VRQELVFRLTVTWPLVALGLAVLALLPAVDSYERCCRKRVRPGSQR